MWYKEGVMDRGLRWNAANLRSGVLATVKSGLSPLAHIVTFQGQRNV